MRGNIPCRGEHVRITGNRVGLRAVFLRAGNLQEEILRKTGKINRCGFQMYVNGGLRP